MKQADTTTSGPPSGSWSETAVTSHPVPIANSDGSPARTARSDHHTLRADRLAIGSTPKNWAGRGDGSSRRPVWSAVAVVG